MQYITTTLLLICLLFTGTLHAKAVNKQIEYVAVGNVPHETMQQIEHVVEKHYKRIIAKYQVKEMPAVTVKIWQDRDAFEKSFGDNAEYVQGYVNQDLWEARFFNGRPELGLGVVHEYTHLVTIALNPTFNNNPRWLWEATATYESERPPVPKISDLKCFSKDTYPTIESLEDHPFNIYRVGYYLTDYIVSTWGQNKLVDLVKSNGDIKQTLNITVIEFEKKWLDYLQKKHKLKLADVAEENC